MFPVCFSLCHASRSLYLDRIVILFEGQRKLSLQHIYSVHISISKIFFLSMETLSFSAYNWLFIRLTRGSLLTVLKIIWSVVSYIIGRGHKGFQWCSFARFLMQFCRNFYFNLQYCSFTKPSGLWYLEIFR